MTYRLDQEEKDILESFERGELVPVANPEQEKEYAILSGAEHVEEDETRQNTKE